MSEDRHESGNAPLMQEPVRCEVCDWPLAKTMEEGCVPGNCSYRPHKGTAEYFRIKKRREELAKPGEAERNRESAARAAIRDARLLLETALVLLEDDEAKARPSTAHPDSATSASPAT
jgi:hypothetical protein